MKVLSVNAGYFLGYSGTHIDYLKDPLRSLRGSDQEYKALDDFIDLVKEEDPDALLVQEVDSGSFRSKLNGQTGFLKDELPEYLVSDFGNKYRGRFFPKLPIFRNMGNSVFCKNGEVKHHSLTIGRKNLVQEIIYDDFSLFSLHLATFGGWIRKRQLRQVVEIAKKRQSYVITGDFNLHKGRKEIDYLEGLLDSKVYSPGATFPAKNPKQKLDLVASSHDITINHLKELGNRFSDHRPIAFDIER